MYLDEHMVGMDLVRELSVMNLRRMIYGRNVGHRNTGRHSIKTDPYTTVLSQYTVLH